MDVLPPDAVNAMYQIIGGAPQAVSPIEQWEEWGLLKSGFAPIRDETGRAVAAAGADVNVTVIRERTLIALLTVLVLGLSALSAGLIIAWLIAQRLSRPMRQLKTLAARATTGSSARLAAAPQLIPELRPTRSRTPGPSQLIQSPGCARSALRSASLGAHSVTEIASGLKPQPRASATSPGEQASMPQPSSSARIPSSDLVTVIAG